MQDIEAINFIHLSTPKTDFDGFVANQRNQSFAFFGRQFLRIIKRDHPMILWPQDRTGHNWSRQRPTTNLIDANHQTHNNSSRIAREALAVTSPVKVS